ncbi:hypothetical protein HDV01_002004 [Terramyces sp. JEL0728]|nr:hypothetical protein HDV01_002004 [Terramyces sp. JEL0728]
MSLGSVQRQVVAIISEINKCLDTWEMISENSLLRIREASNNRLKLSKISTEQSIPKWDLYRMETISFDRKSLKEEFADLTAKLDDTENKFQVHFNKIILGYFKYQETIRDALSTFGSAVLELSLYKNRTHSELDPILHQLVDNLKKEYSLITNIIHKLKESKQLPLNHALVFVSIWTHRPYFTKLADLLDCKEEYNSGEGFI